MLQNSFNTQDSLHTKDYLTQNVNSAEVEKSALENVIPNDANLLSATEYATGCSQNVTFSHSERCSVPSGLRVLNC